MHIIKTLTVISLLTIAGATASQAATPTPESLIGAAAVKGMPAFASVPEPADWAWVAVAGTIGIVAWRRFRRQSA